MTSMIRADNRPEILISPDWLVDHLDDPGIRIIEMGTMDPPRYEEEHIPGALYWPWKESLWDAHRREFLAPRDFAELMSHAGVTPDTTLLFCSDEPQFATYALWTCILRGHARVRLLDGGSPGYRGHSRMVEMLEPMKRMRRTIVAVVPAGDRDVVAAADHVLPVIGTVREAFTGRSHLR